MPWWEDKKSGRRVFSSRQFTLVLLLLALAGAMLGHLGIRIADELQALTAAAHDNQQWEMAQVEVEALVLSDAIKSVEMGLNSSLDEIRRRFDIFYSRVSAIQARRAHVREDSAAGTIATLSRMRTSLDRLVPQIDGSDSELRGHLADLRVEVGRLRADARAVALDYVRYFALGADDERKSLADLIKETSIFSAVFLFFLSISLIILVRLFQLSVDRARALTESRDRFEKTISASLDAIIVTDAAGIVLEVNPAAMQMFCYSRNAFVGSPLSALVTPAHLRDEKEIGLGDFFAAGRSSASDAGRQVTMARRADGTEFPVELSLGASVRGEQRIVIGFVRDISERIRTERELTTARDDALAAARARSDLLAFMSHEMRTPLNGVLAILDLLRETPLNDRQKGYIETAMRSGEILLHLIADALDVTRLQSGLPTLRDEVFDLGELIGEVAEINRPAASAVGDELVVSIDLPSVDTLGDRNRLRQILMNLVGNAIKFTRDGSVRIEARIDRSIPETLAFEIAVVDTGIGVAAEDLVHVFEEFVVLANSGARTPQGSGLGLSISRRLAELMGGTLTATSVLGSGSRFVLKLPFRPAEAEKIVTPPVAVGHPIWPRRGLRVLVVEDNPTNLLITTEMLEMLDASATEAEDGEIGVAKATAERFDLVLMDLGMPKLGGEDATRTIRANPAAASRDVPIVGLTAHALPSVESALIEAGMNHCLYKPLRFAALKALLIDLFGIEEETNSTDPDDDGSNSGADVLEFSELAELSELLGQDRLVERLDVFREEIARASLSLSTLPLRERGAAAHRLAGSAAVFGAVRLRNAAVALEAACVVGDDDAAQRASDALTAAAASTITSVGEVIAEIRA